LFSAQGQNLRKLIPSPCFYWLLKNHQVKLFNPNYKDKFRAKLFPKKVLPEYAYKLINMERNKVSFYLSKYNNCFSVF